MGHQISFLILRDLWSLNIVKANHKWATAGIAGLFLIGKFVQKFYGILLKKVLRKLLKIF